VPGDGSAQAAAAATSQRIGCVGGAAAGGRNEGRVEGADRGLGAIIFHEVRASGPPLHAALWPLLPTAPLPG
jgi:hypothetical protein